jgi:hypothetical protein
VFQNFCTLYYFVIVSLRIWLAEVFLCEDLH